MDSLLIVEDDIAYSTMMQTWLKKKGFDVDKNTILYCQTFVCQTMTDCSCSTGCERAVSFSSSHQPLHCRAIR